MSPDELPKSGKVFFDCRVSAESEHEVDGCCSFSLFVHADHKGRRFVPDVWLALNRSRGQLKTYDHFLLKRIRSHLNPGHRHVQLLVIRILDNDSFREFGADSFSKAAREMSLETQPRPS